jgi:hypothetical protein
MKLRQILRTGLTASAIAHLSALALVIWLAEVHPFGSVTAEPIAVDVVTPEQVAQNEQKKPEPVPTPTIPPSSAVDLPAKPAASSPAASAAQSAPAAPEPAASPPQKQAALPATRPDRQQPRAQPQPQVPSAQPQPPSTQPQLPSAQPQLPSASAVSPPPAAPAYKPPEPDLTVKYHVMLGLPQDNLGAPLTGESGNGGDAASMAANLGSSLVAEFRRHLKTCSKLPDSVAASDNLKIKLRVLMTPEGKLAGRPTVIEASASMKGPLLMQSAIEALQACQPFTMLPVDRYGEWKVLDLDFTPRDFAG